MTGTARKCYRRDFDVLHMLESRVYHASISKMPFIDWILDQKETENASGILPLSKRYVPGVIHGGS